MRLTRYLLRAASWAFFECRNDQSGEETSVASVRILVLEGDGIGPEICASTVRTLTEASQIVGIELNV